MDDLNKKRSTKNGRRHGALPDGPVAADTHAPVAESANGHVPDVALKPMADGAAALAGAVSAAAAAGAPFVATGTGAAMSGTIPAAVGGNAAHSAAAPSGHPQAARAPDGASAARTPAATPEIVQPAARKQDRVKPVRARFAVPKDDHATLDALKEACRANGVQAKKNQLLRVAIGLLREVEPARLAQLVAALPPTARKKK